MIACILHFVFKRFTDWKTFKVKVKKTQFIHNLNINFMTSNENFNRNDLAIVKLPKKIKLTTDSEIPVTILPCQIDQIPQLPDTLRVIGEQNNKVTCLTYGVESETYYRLTEGMGVIKTKKGKFYLYTPIQGELPDKFTIDLSYIQAYAMGEYSGDEMYLTHMYMPKHLIPDSAKMSKFCWIIDWISIWIFGLLGLAGLIVSLLGYGWHLFTFFMGSVMALTIYADVRKVIYVED